MEIDEKIGKLISDILNDLHFEQLNVTELMVVKGHLDYVLNKRIDFLIKDYWTTVKTKDYWEKERGDAKK